MSLVSPNGPRWIRKHKARRDRELAGISPIFLAALFRPQPDLSLGRRPGAGDDPGGDMGGVGSPLVPPQPVLAGGAAKRLEDEPDR